MNKLSTLLPNLISPNQMTFIRGWRISDNVGLCHKFLQCFNHRAGSQRACISIDFSNAFDKMRWDSIDIALEAMGFDQIFRRMVRVCISMASFSMLVEGSPMVTFGAHHGIRQGDPLSPSLFISRRLKEFEHGNLVLYKAGGILVESQ